MLLLIHKAFNIYVQAISQTISGNRLFHPLSPSFYTCHLIGLETEEPKKILVITSFYSTIARYILLTNGLARHIAFELYLLSLLWPYAPPGALATNNNSPAVSSVLRYPLELFPCVTSPFNIFFKLPSPGVAYTNPCICDGIISNLPITHRIFYGMV